MGRSRQLEASPDALPAVPYVPKSEETLFILARGKGQGIFPSCKGSENVIWYVSAKTRR
ncbi:hypothetical protein SBV1_630013 [Verrucomicrobia bacterium]|nr:hypothetical protein SBV1_630013 [Verrucomicrobiota bacterium]